MAKQRRRRSAFNPINWTLYLTVGYGYRTWLTGVWPTGLAGFGVAVHPRLPPVGRLLTTPAVAGLTGIFKRTPKR